jgi:hypothetical protein
MNDPPAVNWFTYILGGLVALLASIFEFYRRRVDKIEAAYVSREDLKHTLDQMREDRIEMHKENIGRLDGIHDDMDRIHDRIDQIFRSK